MNGHDDVTGPPAPGPVLAFRGPGPAAAPAPAAPSSRQADLVEIADALERLDDQTSILAVHRFLCALGVLRLHALDNRDAVDFLDWAIQLAGEHVNLPPARRVALGLSITRRGLEKGAPGGSDRAAVAEARGAAIEGLLAQMSPTDQTVVTGLAAGIVEARQGDVGPIRRDVLALFRQLFSASDWAAFIVRAAQRLARAQGGKRPRSTRPDPLALARDVDVADDELPPGA